ncbi:type 1 angiotensin II receptor associated [Trichuris trichiura]|uniref:Type 1 angiotensin II receptor associated n=1 Tax=Trichuris trichiura TaxID=36087 RepID=A0A077Z9X0_TRITR|nr:type 1 angiotensin II receptor associated [Trichuris trichiura]
MQKTLPELKIQHSIALKGILIAHFVLVSLTLTGYWVPLSYLFVNSVFLASLFWAQSLNDGDSIAALMLPLQFQAFCFLMDIIIMGTRYSRSYNYMAIDQFSLAMAIINLLLRPASSFLLYYIRQQRYRTKFATTAPTPPTVVVTSSTVNTVGPGNSH